MTWPAVAGMVSVVAEQRLRDRLSASTASLEWVREAAAAAYEMAWSPPGRDPAEPRSASGPPTGSMPVRLSRDGGPEGEVAPPDPAAAAHYRTAVAALIAADAAAARAWGVRAGYATWSSTLEVEEVRRLTGRAELVGQLPGPAKLTEGAAWIRAALQRIDATWPADGVPRPLAHAVGDVCRAVDRAVGELRRAAPVVAQPRRRTPPGPAKQPPKQKGVHA